MLTGDGILDCGANQGRCMLRGRDTEAKAKLIDLYNLVMYKTVIFRAENRDLRLRVQIMCLFNHVHGIS